jgi:hypothetical protein
MSFFVVAIYKIFPGRTEPRTTEKNDTKVRDRKIPGSLREEGVLGL